MSLSEPDSSLQNTISKVNIGGTSYNVCDSGARQQCFYSDGRTLTLTSKFIPYSSDESDAPAYCTIGPIVFLGGAIKATSAIAHDFTENVISYLPTYLYPSIPVYSRQQASGYGHGLLQVKLNGNLTLSRYSAEDGTSNGITTSTGLPFNISYIRQWVSYEHEYEGE